MTGKAPVTATTSISKSSSYGRSARNLLWSENPRKLSSFQPAATLHEDPDAHNCAACYVCVQTKHVSAELGASDVELPVLLEDIESLSAKRLCGIYGRSRPAETPGVAGSGAEAFMALVNATIIKIFQ